MTAQALPLSGLKYVSKGSVTLMFIRNHCCAPDLKEDFQLNLMEISNYMLVFQTSINI